MKTPELLCPAGSLEKLKTAISYGANAVYVGGQKFGLRAAAENFSVDELIEGVSYAHTRGAKVFVALNSFFVDQDIVELPDFIKILAEINVDAVIVSDLGGVRMVRSVAPDLPVHLSTQSSCLNKYSGQFWKKMGVTRLILGREVTILEAHAIKLATGLEVELFIHGSMCSAYSGNCVISNFTSGRDSNRGGCKHSCRFEYTLESKNQAATTYFMSSKDLNGIKLLPEFIKYEIDSIKVEGRMKSNLYAAVVAKAYSRSINAFVSGMRDSELESELAAEFIELNKLPHRDYFTGSLKSAARFDSTFHEREDVNRKEYAQVGTVSAIFDNEMFIDVKNAFNQGDTLEIIPFTGQNLTVKVDSMVNVFNESVVRTKPNSLVKVPRVTGVTVGNIVRPYREL